MAKAKILVVDDESKIRESFSDILSLEDFDVDTAQNGEEAINLIEEDFYDVASLT
jgi:DNA-binding NtrC family response regulator